MFKTADVQSQSGQPKLTARQQQILELVQTAIRRTGAHLPGPKLPLNWALSPPTLLKSIYRPWPAKA